MSASTFTSVFVRLSGLMAEGRMVLFRHCIRYGQSDQIILLASSRLRSFEIRMQSLVARWRAGKLVVRIRKHCAKKPAPPKLETDETAPKPVRLPTGFGWLSKRIRPDGFGMAAQLPEIIADPEMVALLAAGPQAARLLRPLCHMYGVKVDAIALPRRKRAPRPPTPEQSERQAEREEAKRQRQLAKTSSKKSVVPKGHTYPVTERDWAIWIRRNKRNMRRWRAGKWKTA